MAAAIVALACRYPDAPTPEALLQNALEGRRAFRTIPAERLELARYAAEIVGEADSITAIKAGLLTGWRFDCARFRIPQLTFEAADLSHWLALDIAAEAVEAVGGPDVLDRDRTAVVVANTLTGEFSRAALLRLRAPFLDEVLAQAIAESDVADGPAADLRRRFGAVLRERFPVPNEETLAGGLANTIAGRIANYFDLHGGAYTVDAACASSLVAVADAANLLVLGQVDTVIVGAVDLSLDPFELVGFSRNGALARDEMRVFDARSSGFWPGEGAAFLLLMREEDARRRGLPVRAVLRGCGISSDGAGGLTRPTVGGQLLALRRAYEAAAVDPAEVGYIEAHGTGTAVGDAVEVRALACLRNGASRPLPIGSIKANIGHTKAAAGLAGMIKTIGALSAGYLPPHVSCAVPHPVFREIDDAVRPVVEGGPWPAQSPRLAGVSSFGFGGINAHVVLECNGEGPVSVALSPRYRPQDAELFVFSAQAADGLTSRMARIRKRTASLSLAEFTDLAAACATEVVQGELRAAIVATEPDDLSRKLDSVISAVAGGRECIDTEHGICVGRRTSPPRIGLLFPGQAAPSRPQGGTWARRFEIAQKIVTAIPCGNGDAVQTEIAQPAIVGASLAAWQVLQSCNIDARIALGHSLGELTALVWAGALRPADLVPLAAVRGAVMATRGRPGGGMLRIAAGCEPVRAFIAGLDLAIACKNGPTETVLSGPQSAIATAGEHARRAGFETTNLAVSHAFHSAMMEPAVAAFAAELSNFALGRLERSVISTVTGTKLDPGEDLYALLVRQLMVPVLFEQALRRMATETDMLIEVGPGSGLSRLARQMHLAAASVDAFADSLFPLLSAIGAVFALGAAVRFDPLFRDRPTRPINLDDVPQFLTNPCGRRSAVPAPEPALLPNGPDAHGPETTRDGMPLVAATGALAVVRTVIAEETGFAAADISDDARLLDDLHLNSLAVSRIVMKAARLLSCTPPAVPTEMARATPRELATALSELSRLGPGARRDPDRIPGVRPWVRTFAVRWSECPPPRRSTRVSQWRVLSIGQSEGDRPILDSIAKRPGQPNALLVWLGSEFDDAATPQLFAACRTAWAAGDVQRLAICHVGAPVSAFARTLAVEGRFESITVIERHSRSCATERILGELDAESAGFMEVRLDGEGRRFEPRFVAATPGCAKDASIDRNDVLLVTGGAKGIGAECALRIATRSGAALILAGRSSRDDPAVRETLDRAAALGLRCGYAAADVCDPLALREAVAAATHEIGPITGLIHAAGENDPTLFHEISDEDLRRVLAPKTVGLRAAIAAAGPRLRRIVTFGSILGRMGLKGEAHYAVANAWQSAIAEQFSRERPDCHVLSLEWSLWNGVGMGHRLGSLERLARFGVDALPVEVALDTFESLLLHGANGTFMVTSRFGPPWHVSLGASELPLLRFIDKPLLHYPGVELVVETELSGGRDLYLADHRVEGAMVVPAVLGLEAMAQVAGALAGQDAPFEIEAVAFSQAIHVPENGAVRIRIMALAADPCRVEVAIRGEHDAFATECMRATLRFGASAPIATSPPLRIESAAPIDAGPLYGPLLFQGERFRCIRCFTHVSARRIAALLFRDDAPEWFSAFEAQHLVLGDPGIRDALLHALQAAVPHRRVIPISVSRIAFHPGGPPVRVDAIERHATADTFEFDIVCRDSVGIVVEEWQGVVFRAISDIDELDRVLATAPALCVAYVERTARAALDNGSIEVALVADGMLTRDKRRGRALAALGLDGRVFTRTDGKPVVIDSEPSTLSIAHRNGVTLAVKASRNVGCDIEAISDWSGPDAALPLSASAQALAREIASDVEPWAVAAARVWAASEASLKHELPSEAAYRTHRRRDDKMVLFETASGRTATMRVPCPGGDLVIAISVRSADPPVPALGVALQASS